MNGVLIEDVISLQEFEDAVPGEWLALVLEAADIRELNGHQLVEFVAAVQRQKAHLDALAMQAIHELTHCPLGDDDSPPQRTELPGDRAVGVVEMHCGWSRYKAGRHVALAMDLGTELTETRKALHAGEIESDTARVIAERTEAIRDPWIRREVESKTLEYVRSGSAKGLRRTRSQVKEKVDREVLRVEPDAVKKRHEKRVEDRGVAIQVGDDCTADLCVYNLPADRAAEAYARIDALAREAKRVGDSQGRTLAQLRADIAGSLWDGTGRVVDPDADGSAEPTDRRAGGRIVLVTTFREMLDLTDGTSSLGWIGPICSEIARRMTLAHLDNPSMEYDVVITDPRTGRVRQIHPLSRLFTGRLRDTIEITRPRCDWPTCHRTSLDCEIDHIVEYANGGATNLDNGSPKCGAGHHREKTVNGWTDRARPGSTSTRDPDRELVSPYGHRYAVEPDPLVAPALADDPPF